MSEDLANASTSPRTGGVPAAASPTATTIFATAEEVNAQSHRATEGPPPSRRIGLRLVLSVVTFFVVGGYLFLLAGFLSSPSEPSARPGDPVSNHAEVGAPEDIGFGNVVVPVQVTNPSVTEYYDYSVLVAAMGDTADGNRESWTLEFDNVAPGETARAEVVFTEPRPEPQSFAVVEATRNLSLVSR